jgi:hypothetical protein
MSWMAEIQEEQLVSSIEVEARPTMNIKQLIGRMNLRGKPPVWQRPRWPLLPKRPVV